MHPSRPVVRPDCQCSSSSICCIRRKSIQVSPGLPGWQASESAVTLPPAGRASESGNVRACAVHCVDSRPHRAWRRRLGPCSGLHSAGVPRGDERLPARPVQGHTAAPLAGLAAALQSSTPKVVLGWGCWDWGAPLAPKSPPQDPLACSAQRLMRAFVRGLAGSGGPASLLSARRAARSRRRR